MIHERFTWGGDKVFRIVTSPVLFSALLTLMVFLLLPSIPQYTLEILKTGFADKQGSMVLMADMDHDGKDEKIVVFNSMRNQAAVKIMNLNNVFLGWWDFEGTLLSMFSKIEDTDKDGFPELYFFTNHADTILVHQFRCTSMDKTFHRSAKAGITRLIDGRADCQIGPLATCDLTNDGHTDLAFSLNAGYSLIPRKLVVWDLHRDTLVQGPLTGVNAFYLAVNLDQDPFPEFIASSSSTKNYPDSTSILCSDHSSWMFVLDHDLQFLFPPVENPGHKSSIETGVFKTNNGNLLLCLFNNSNQGKPTTSLNLFNLQGKLVKTKSLNTGGHQEQYRLSDLDSASGTGWHLLKKSGGSIRIDKELLLNNPGPTLPSYSSPIFTGDLDNDGQQEFVFHGNDQESLIITRHNYSFPVKVDVDFSYSGPNLSLFRDESRQPLLLFQAGSKEYIIKYRRNQMYDLRMLLWLGVFAGVCLLVFLVRWQLLLRQNRKKKMTDKIASLQLSLMSKHLDPHFAFNTLNTISSLIYKENREEAYQLFSRFVSMIRFSMENSAKYATTLGEELEFLRNYLALMHVRFDGKIQHEIVGYEEQMNKIRVPRMMLQHYAENAIKHGLRDMSDGGLIRFEFIREQRSLCILISDNGVGRQQAQINDPSREGTGLRTMETIHALFYRLTGTRITHHFEDLTDPQGSILGTRVILKLEGAQLVTEV